MAKNNECIEERENSYRVKIAYTDELGNRKFYSKSFSIKKYGTKQKALENAKKHRDEMRVNIKNNLIVKKNIYTLDDVFNETMNLYVSNLETKRKLVGMYGKHIQSFIGGERLFHSIRFDDIQKTLNNMVSKSKDDTIQRVMYIWSRMYRYAIAKNIVYKDETYNVNVPKSDIPNIKKNMSITDEDFIKALAMINDCSYDYREKQLVMGALLIMRYEGMRPSEVFGLEKKNVDLANMTIYVCQRLGTSSTEFNTITHPKTENANRYIPIDTKLLGTFKILFDLSEGEYLFLKNNGDFMNGDYLCKFCRRFTKGLLRPYQLRHQFSSDLILSGIDIRTIQELMGHANSSMTLEYARSNDELKRKALEERILH